MTEAKLRSALGQFVRESNWIEGICRDPSQAEIDAHAVFLALPNITLDALVALVGVLQPNAHLRDRTGLNVYVGDHVPPPGGAAIPLALSDLLERAGDPYQTHVEYETLHPFTDGNGRSGRALWLWTMGGIDRAPLGFLHHWYYQSLSGSGFRGKADTKPLARQALSELNREGEGWQPIETAPRDGSYIIAAHFGPGGSLEWVKDSRWDTAVGAAEADGLTAAQADDYETGWQCADAYNDGTCGPTHWMPLMPPHLAALTTTNQGEGS